MEPLWVVVKHEEGKTQRRPLHPRGGPPGRLWLPALFCRPSPSTAPRRRQGGRHHHSLEATRSQSHKRKQPVAELSLEGVPVTSHLTRDVSLDFVCTKNKRPSH
ncbi:Hypothetical predicted protein [Marmota monax]|uniref:Uncharacterized protein n=1 Tax=Marmota monax TaxID=9995 RepID=A0A5E4AV83_MARMO|nr:hypothetical protein GHT09_016070 [Marmota monax]VTJ60449.1 Hypothetical predicted protein [Marmota monax]